jgi:hypothetical protein
MQSVNPEQIKSFRRVCSKAFSSFIIACSFPDIYRASFGPQVRPAAEVPAGDGGNSFLLYQTAGTGSRIYLHIYHYFLDKRIHLTYNWLHQNGRGRYKTRPETPWCAVFRVSHAKNRFYDLF